MQEIQSIFFLWQEKRLAHLSYYRNFIFLLDLTLENDKVWHKIGEIYWIYF